MSETMIDTLHLPTRPFERRVSLEAIKRNRRDARVGESATVHTGRDGWHRGTIVAVGAETLTVEVPWYLHPQRYERRWDAFGEEGAIVPVRCTDCRGETGPLEHARERGGLLRCQHCHAHAVWAEGPASACERCGAEGPTESPTGDSWLCRECLAVYDRRLTRLVAAWTAATKGM